MDFTYIKKPVKTLSPTLYHQLWNLTLGDRGLMQEMLENAKTTRTGIAHIAYLGSNPVGWSLVTKLADGRNVVNTYVTPGYRRMGIGSELAKSAKGKRKEIYADIPYRHRDRLGYHRIDYYEVERLI